ncbi:NNP family nitrate/nitrite transporter-like MFS transporter [Fluviicoccus keumensis]|uniref:Nitrate/nitrite transporter n=1 Tax=Fluviicoccus keumensis TaxID=1435465 RepID=A0A4Q7YNQ4_9GAMM|nr:NarK family nitrate/nitrite MFS transporter [Fluviicoccus keumensis]RZU38471.1 NNP family nitrate/nitrite transporter-like MFS transporter [Fluviicoccus keumensis]
MSSVLKKWEPENPAFWNDTGKSIANRNLWISIPCLLLAFAVWMVWSMVVVKLPDVGFKYDKNQLFWLTALPALSGATLRIFYSFLVPVFGGRRWTAISTASLLLPAIGIGYAVQDPTTSYPTMMMLALLCGFGGGNFSSSMSNINFFFPKAQKGYALGMNAGLGNLGVSAMQFIVPIVITMGVFGALGGDPQTIVKDGVSKSVFLQNAGFIWVPFIALSAIAAWFGMNDIASAKASFAEQSVIFKRKHNWLMCWLYLGTFGSFIGFSAGFPLLIKGLFPDVDPTKIAFLGPLVGAIARPIGGVIADKLGGARVTFWVFVAMVLAVFAVISFMPVKVDGALTGGNFQGFFAAFLCLFALTGIGNASTFRMIPVIFLTQHERMAKGNKAVTRDQVLQNANKEAAAVLGFSGAIGAYGGFFIPKSYGTSIAIMGSPVGALYAFILFYATCLIVTWWFYSRKNAEMPC